MAFGKSIKMYLTIFVATTCIYMVLYQYHTSRQTLTATDIMKTNKDLGPISAAMAHSADAQQNSAHKLKFEAGKINENIKTDSLTLTSNPLTNTTSNTMNNKTHEYKTMDSVTKSLTTAQNNTQSNSTIKYTSTYQLTFQSYPETSSAFQSSQSSSSKTTGSTNFHAFYYQRHGAVDNSQHVEALHLLSNNAKHQTKTTTKAIKANTSSFKTTPSTSRLGIKAQMDSTAAIQGNGGSSSSVTSNRSQPTHLNTPASLAAATTTTTPTLPTAITTTTVSNILLTHQAQHSPSSPSSSSSFQRLPSSSALYRASPSGFMASELIVASASGAAGAVQMPPPLYIITPTYRRPEQLAELTRLGYTLKHVLNLLWLVIEDANVTSPLVTQTLNRIGVPYEYLVAPMPEIYKKTKKAKPRGVSNRNRGLDWLRANATDGVFYFADDDNTYDISIFEQMRYTKKVSMWPVGLVTKFGVSSPIIRQGRIIGFYDGWIGGRKYPVDMAGFAVSVRFLLQRPSAKMPYKPGYEEDGFLKSLSPLNNTEIELLAANCTEILTWHTQTKKNAPASALNMDKYGDTNLASIDRLLIRP